MYQRSSNDQEALGEMCLVAFSALSFALLFSLGLIWTVLTVS